MVSRGLKYLPVVDAAALVGIVSLTDLMRFRSQKSVLLIAAVRESRTVEDLARVKSEIVKVAEALMGEVRSHFETMEIISYLHHSILQRAFELVLKEFADAGRQPPDIRFCLMIMGSGGRKEMLLNPDQDNGLIYENFPEERRAEVDAFMVPFAERLVEVYAQIGYPKCHGKVMVDNPLWRGTLDDWAERIADWVQVPEPKKVMYSTIFLDFMPLVGDPTLCQDLRDVVHAVVRRNPRFMYHLLENDLNLKLPLGMLGRFVLEKSGEHKGKISLKQAGSIFIVRLRPHLPARKERRRHHHHRATRQVGRVQRLYAGDRRAYPRRARSIHLPAPAQRDRTAASGRGAESLPRPRPAQRHGAGSAARGLQGGGQGAGFGEEAFRAGRRVKNDG